MSHLTPETLVDAAEGRVNGAMRSHLDTCTTCRRQVDELAAIVAGLGTTPIPEPSPLFWDHLSARVRQEVAAAGAPAGTRWFDWRVLVPATAAAALVLALVSALPTTSPDAPTSAANAAPALEADDASWELLAALLDDEALADDAAAEGKSVAAVAWRGAADRVVFELSSAEQEELLRLLREEVRAGG